MFAAAWGAFPVLTGYYAQHERLDLAAVAAAVFAFFLSTAQRRLSTPARTLRRKTADVEGTIVSFRRRHQRHRSGTAAGAARRRTPSTELGDAVCLAVTLVLARLDALAMTNRHRRRRRSSAVDRPG